MFVRLSSLSPAVTLRAGPPSHVLRASSVIAGLTLVLAVIPLRSYARVERLQGIALADSMASAAWTARLMLVSMVVRPCSPAVLLACWALVAEPEDLLAASQPDFVREVALLCIAPVIPLGQQDRVLCNGWVPDPW